MLFCIYWRLSVVYRCWWCYARTLWWAQELKLQIWHDCKQQLLKYAVMLRMFTASRGLLLATLTTIHLLLMFSLTWVYQIYTYMMLQIYCMYLGFSVNISLSCCCWFGKWRACNLLNCALSMFKGGIGPVVSADNGSVKWKLTDAVWNVTIRIAVVDLDEWVVNVKCITFFMWQATERLNVRPFQLFYLRCWYSFKFVSISVHKWYILH